MHSYVHCGIICNSQDTEATQVPINRQADKKQWYLHTMEYYLAKKKNEIICDSMGIPRG